jgi:SAM-dependent methyltransferase
MFKELRPVVAGTDNGDGEFEGISVSTPESWARNFAASTKLTFLQRIKISIDLRYRLIRKYIRPGGKILDAGCGFGEWVSFLNERHFAAAGLDYSDTLINRLKVVYPQTEWIYGTIEDVPAPSGKYDGLISWGVIPKSANRRKQRAMRWFACSMRARSPCRGSVKTNMAAASMRMSRPRVRWMYRCL